MGVSHTDNWQKVKREYSDHLRDNRQVTTKEDMKAARLIEQQVKNTVKMDKASEPNTALPKVANPIKEPALPGRDVSQAQQKARPELQDHATRQEARAAQNEFVKDKQRASDLRQLEGRVELRVTDRAVTRHAVSAKPGLAETQISRQPQPQVQTAANVVDIASREAARQNAARHVVKSRKPEGDARQEDPKKSPKLVTQGEGGKQTTENAPRVAAPVIQTQKRPPERDPESLKEKKVAKKEGGRTGAARAGSASSRAPDGAKTGDLSGLLGGGVGTEPMPEFDENFKVYNEYSSDVPGPEYMKSKWQLLERNVVRRLAEIASLDQEVSFKIQKLSERIEGGFTNDIRLADFIKNVYGGTRG